ncbi:hypothetical protein MMC17_003369 [Xylographa soralifera]|nr:hypothetical protein [Xylographa soralifera]
MKYTLFTSFALLLPLLVSGASIGNRDRRDQGLVQGRLDRVVRSASGTPYTITDIPINLTRRKNAVRREQSVAAVRERRSLQSRDALPGSSTSIKSHSQVMLRRRNAAKRAVLQNKLSSRQQLKQELRNRAARYGDAHERDLAAKIDSSALKRSLVSRSPKDKKPKESKEEKKIDGAKKTLTDDLASEKKAQDKAAASAVKGVDKAESKADKSVAKEEKKEQKSEAKATKGLEKAEANEAKEEKDKGKPGKAGKAYDKAENNLKKAEGGLDKTKANGADSIKKVNDKEDKDISKTGQKLDKAQTKAHDDQFGAAGGRLAKSHPTAWQKFKSVMAKIGEGIEWAITGLSLLVPGTEEAGLARLAAKGAEMIAEKAAKTGVKKAAEKGIKKGAKEEGKKQLNGQSGDSAVDAAKTESDAQVAAGKANAQKGQDQFSAAAAAAKAKQPGGKRDAGLDARILHARYSPWGVQR